MYSVYIYLGLQDDCKSRECVLVLKTGTWNVEINFVTDLDYTG